MIPSCTIKEGTVPSNTIVQSIVGKNGLVLSETLVTGLPITGLPVTSTSNGIQFILGTSHTLDVESLDDYAAINPMVMALASGSSFSDSSRGSEMYSGYIIYSVFSGVDDNDVTFDKTEGAIAYIRETPVTDYTFYLMSKTRSRTWKIAVEVKRIHPYKGVTVDSHYIHRVLNHANDGAIKSNRNVCSADQWNAQILHVITSCDYVIDEVMAWSNTVAVSGFAGVIVTHVTGDNLHLVF